MSRSTVQKLPEGWLVNLRHDLGAALVVALVSVTFSPAIAIASGAPAVAGLKTAIVAGIICCAVRGFNLAVVGPAAGLSMVLHDLMYQLGGGDLTVGYPRLLALIILVSGLMVVLNWLGVARISVLFPKAVIAGMMAGIGAMLLLKQLAPLGGFTWHGHETVAILSELPEMMGRLSVRVTALGGGCLLMIFLLDMVAARWKKDKPWLCMVPPHVLVVIIGVTAGWLIGLDKQYLISLPDNPLEIITPDFTGLFVNTTLWWLALKVLMLASIDIVETLAALEGADDIDPYRRKSNPRKVLLGMALANLVSALIGGLTSIIGCIKTRANTDAGARTWRSCLYNALLLLLFLCVATHLMKMIPYAVLAAVLIHVGCKLCSKWRAMWKMGAEHFALFSVTAAVTVGVDLLWEVLIGVVLKLVLSAVRAKRRMPVSLEPVSQEC